MNRSSLRASNWTRRQFLAGSLGFAGVTLGACGGTAVHAVPAATIAPFPGLGDPPLLVDVAWLRQQRENAGGNLVLLDFSNLPSYRRGHVPNAAHAWWQDWIDPFSDIYGVLLSTRNVPTARTDLLGDLGIDDNTTVVAYDVHQNRYAAHFVWIMRYFGHPAAMVLDGGLAAWLGEGGEKSKDTVDLAEARSTTVSPQSGWTIPFDELRERFQDPAIALLDVRTDKEADDDLNGLLSHGQIPGSIRLPWTATVRDDAGRFKDPAELGQMFQQAGVMPDREVIVIARFGVETGLSWLVLSLLGYPHVRVFDRGWAHWGRKDLDLPIEPLAPLA